MSKTRYLKLSVVALAIAVTALVAVPWPASAQLPGLGGTSSSTGTGATALQATVLWNTTSLASTGTLANAYDALGEELDSGGIPVGSADVLHAVAIGSGDYVTSESSLGNLDLSVAGIAISAVSAYATAVATSAGGISGFSSVDGLTVNGVSIAPTGAVNQTVGLGAVTLVLNEVTQSASGITVNALHISTLDGLVDVVVASASAAIP